ncbi:MAG: hypothetical protein ACE5RC_09225, partial [Nitrosopumilus sp.]
MTKIGNFEIWSSEDDNEELQIIILYKGFYFDTVEEFPIAVGVIKNLSFSNTFKILKIEVVKLGYDVK